MITETQRILGALNIREIQILRKLVHAQVGLADSSYMEGIYLPNLEDRLADAVNSASRHTGIAPAHMRRGEVNMGNQEGIDYKIIFRSSSRVPAIKFLRELWNYGLKEAKDVSDLAWNPDEVWNTLIVRNDTRYNLARAPILIEEHTARGRRLHHSDYMDDDEPFARIEEYTEPEAQE